MGVNFQIWEGWVGESKNPSWISPAFSKLSAGGINSAKIKQYGNAAYGIASGVVRTRVVREFAVLLQMA